LSLVRAATMINKHVVDHHFGAFGREQERLTSANPPTCAGNDCDLARQAFAAVLPRHGDLPFTKAEGEKSAAAQILA
jgi:hypothetical protein